MSRAAISSAGMRQIAHQTMATHGESTISHREAPARRGCRARAASSQANNDCSICSA
jgi:hypothetical protein